jgi:DNA-binding MarR family transcriptional regulator
MARRGATNGTAGEQVAAGLFKLSLVLRHQAWQASGQQGLTPTQSQILALLNAPDGTTSVSGVAEALSITKGTASEAVSALERKGLLRKEPDPADGRAILLKLTQGGRAEAERSAQWPEILVQAVEALPDAEQAGFLRGLMGLIRALQEQGAVPTARRWAECRYFRPNQYPGKPKPHRCEYLRAAIADTDFRIDCPEMEPAAPEIRQQLVTALFNGTQLVSLGTRGRP